MARADLDACDPCSRGHHGDCDDESCECCGRRAGVTSTDDETERS